MFNACGIKIKSFHHICQDEVCQGKFISSKGNRVWYGAVSDGCSKAIGSHLGAKFLVDQFARLVPEYYNFGLRKDELVRVIAVRLIESMAKYRSQDDHSELTSVNGNRLCSELTASLQAYIADQDDVVLMMAGDGYIAINGKIAKIDQGDGATYLGTYLYFPQEDWVENLKYLYVFPVLPTAAINSLILSTDGLETDKLNMDNDLARLLNNPRKFVLLMREQAMQPALPFHRSDDTSIVALFRTHGQATESLNYDPVVKIKDLAERRSNGGIFAKAGRPTATIERAADENHWKQTFEIKHDSLSDDNEIGVTLYGFEETAVRVTSPAPASVTVEQAKSGTFTKETSNRRARHQADKSRDVKPVHRNISKRPIADEELISLEQLGDYGYCLRHRIGPRACYQVLVKVQHGVEALHAQGFRLGNMRPRDVIVKVVGRKFADSKVGFVGAADWAKYESGNGLVKPYTNLDKNFIHPTLMLDLQDQNGDDQMRLQQDNFGLANLMVNLLLKMDPFMVGTVKDMPDANRKYRMKYELSFWTRSKLNEPERRSWSFYTKGFDRLSTDIQNYCVATIDCLDFSWEIPASLATMADELIRCQAERTWPDGHTNTCHFQVHRSVTICPVCRGYVDGRPLKKGRHWDNRIPNQPSLFKSKP